MKQNFKSFLLLLVFSTGVNAFQQEIKDNSEINRIYVENHMVSVGKVYLSDLELFRSSLFTFDDSTLNIYTYDYAENNLFKVSTHISGQEKIIKKTIIGKGLGSGPGEFRNPTGICVVRNEGKELIVVSDPDLAKVSIWNQNGGLINEFITRGFNPFRIACKDKLIALYSLIDTEKGNLSIYDFEGNLIKRSVLRYSIEGSDLNNSSGFIAMSDSNVFFSGTDYGIISSQSIHTSEQKLATNVDSKEYNNDFVSKKRGNAIYHMKGENYKYYSRGVGSRSQYLYILYSERRDAFSKVIDVYDNRNLTYLFSIKLDEYANTLVMNGDYLLLNSFDEELRDTYLKLFQVVKGEGSD